MSAKALIAASLAAAAACLGGTSSAAAGAAIGVIDVVATEGGIEIVGRAVGMAEGRITGEMVINRKGASGSVSTRQGGEFDLAPGKSADIARVGVSYDSGDQLEITLTLRKDGAVIAESALTTRAN